MIIEDGAGGPHTIRLQHRRAACPAQPRWGQAGWGERARAGGRVPALRHRGLAGVGTRPLPGRWLRWGMLGYYRHCCRRGRGSCPTRPTVVQVGSNIPAATQGGPGAHPAALGEGVRGPRAILRRYPPPYSLSRGRAARDAAYQRAAHTTGQVHRRGAGRVHR